LPFPHAVFKLHACVRIMSVYTVRFGAGGDEYGKPERVSRIRKGSTVRQDVNRVTLDDVNAFLETNPKYRDTYNPAAEEGAVDLTSDDPEKAPLDEAPAPMEPDGLRRSSRRRDHAPKGVSHTINIYGGRRWFVNSEDGNCAFESLAQIWFPYPEGDPLFQRYVVPAGKRLRLYISIMLLEPAGDHGWSALDYIMRRSRTIDDEGRQYTPHQYSAHIRKNKEWASDIVFTCFVDVAPVNIELLYENSVASNKTNGRAIADPSGVTTIPFSRMNGLNLVPNRYVHRIWGNGKHFELEEHKNPPTVDFPTFLNNIENALLSNENRILLLTKDRQITG